jgi:hypothetical protein
LAKCESRKCVYTLQRNCCGNRINETLENGKPGNQCTCPTDYGKCEGKGKIKIGSRLEDTIYAHYYCNVDNQCVFGVERKDIAPQNFLDVINVGHFKASSVAKYNKPFDVSNDAFELVITLDDVSKDLVLPVTFTKIKLLYSSEYSRTEQLIAEKILDTPLNALGDEVTITTDLNLNYKPEQAEETGSLRYSVDYSYTKQVLSGKDEAGNIYTNEEERGTFTSPTKPIFLVKSE